LVVQELRTIQKINGRPKNRLGFKTPNEVFMQFLSRFALRVRIDVYHKA
jgi:IS30 family transposase